MTRRRYFAAAVIASIVLAGGYLVAMQLAGMIRWRHDTRRAPMARRG